MWTEKVLELLDKCAKEGMTRPEIAAVLSSTFNFHCTANMVTGKMHRIKVGNGHIPLKRTEKPWSWPRHKNHIPKSRILEPIKPRFQPDWECQFIDDNNIKCCKPSKGPWCEEHRKRVYVDRSELVKSNHKAAKTARLFRI